MKITKKALNANAQKNISVDCDMYLGKELKEMHEARIIDLLLGDYVVYLAHVDKIEVVYKYGYFANVALLKSGEKIFVTL